MKLKHILLIILLLAWVVLVTYLYTLPERKAREEKREKVLDRIVHIEEKLILDIPKPPRFCDQLELEKKRINIGDCELYCEAKGEGMPVVLLHGGPGATHHYFHPHFSKARDFAQIIYYDQRGCGLSDYQKGKGYTVDQAVDDLENLRKALDIDKWVVLGHSYGGLLAQAYAIKYSKSLAGLVLVGSSLGMQIPLKPTRQYNFMSKEERAKIKEIRAKAANGELTIEQNIYNAFLNGDWKRQTYYKPSRERIAQIAFYEWKHDANFNEIMSRDSDKYDLQGAFNNYPIPTIIIEGKWDLTWNTDEPEILHKNHPASRLVMFEHSGHNPFEDEPEKFFQTLKDFIQKLPEVSDSDLAKWERYLSEWRKGKKDPLLISEMSPAEAKAIAEFKEIRKKIQAGEKFEDGSTPLQAFLTFLSGLHFHDIKALKRNSPIDIELTDQIMTQWEAEFSQLDILRAPPPPQSPKQGEIWPIYVKEVAKAELRDTHLCVFWNGRWMRFGNMGGPVDWRIMEPQIKAMLEKAGKK